MDPRKAILEAICNIQFALKDYENGTFAAVHDFREKNKKDLHIYTKDYQDQYRATIQGNLKAEVETQRRLCQKSVSEEVQAMREAYTLSCADIPAQNALSRLRVFQDFGIPMTENDVLSLAESFKGNMLGLRALSAVASASGWNVSLPLWDSLPAALDKLDSAMKTPERSAFAGIPEYVALLNGENKSVRIHAAAVTLNQAIEGLTRIAEHLERQGVSIHAKENEKKQGETGQGGNTEENAVVISASESKAETLARQIGIEKSTNEALNRAGTEHYTLKR